MSERPEFEDATREAVLALLGHKPLAEQSDEELAELREAIDQTAAEREKAEGAAFVEALLAGNPRKNARDQALTDLLHPPEES